MLDHIVAQSVLKFTGNNGDGSDLRSRRQIDDGSGDEGE